ncbi:hypothetical protein GCM10020000_43820 [Streptomyces olivoverticillatus]
MGALPLDSNVTETTVLKVPDYRDKNGNKDQLGFKGFFVPTLDLRTGTMFSQFPGLDNPVLVLTAYHGSLGIDSGMPQNVYQLDLSKMKQFKDKDGSAFKSMLKAGDTMTLPDGAGTLKFEGIKNWATFQVSHQPGNETALAGAAAALLGLAGSLFIQRRRIWVRAVEGEDGRTVVELAGLGRSESARLPEELADIAVALQDAAPLVTPRRPRRTVRRSARVNLAAATNENLAHISNVLVYSAMAVYTLAFLAHITEWVFGSRSAVGRTAAAITTQLGRRHRHRARREREGRRHGRPRAPQGDHPRRPRQP